MLNRMKRLLAVLLVALIMLISGTGALASFEARINSSSAKVYASPSTSARYVSGGKGKTVTVTGYSGSWARVRRGGYTGYIQVKYLDRTDRLKAYVGKSTTLYKNAGSGGLGTLPFATKVYVVGMSGNYFRVQNDSASVTGYVKKNALVTYSELQDLMEDDNQGSQNSGSSSGGSSSGDTSGSTSAASKIDKVIAEAKKHLGKPYSTSANPPSSFDCSSFVEYCFEKYGYSVKDTAAGQAADSSMEKIGKSKIKKGDILCFDTNEDGACDHTAIALSSSSFIEASQNAGSVRTASMTDWYYEHLMFARRP